MSQALAYAWHTDLDLGLEVECMADIVKSRKAGFLGYQDSRDSFFDLFNRPPTRAGHPLNKHQVESSSMARDIDRCGDLH
jgi:hypothetical protein